MPGGALKDEIIAASLNDRRIIYVGSLSKAEIMQSLCEYDFLVLPSKEEPFGIVLIEALSSGVPCIVSNALGPDEIINEGTTGFKFDLNDAAASFSNAMKKSVELSDENYKDMVENCLKEGKKYSPRSIFLAWEKLLRTTL